MEHFVSGFFSSYAYSPYLVYSAIWGFMLLSAFGLPLPEEVILVSAGLVGYMSLHPDKFPPPFPDAPHVNVYVLAVVSLLAVLSSDYLIYYLGARLGPRLFKIRWFSRLVSESRLQKIQRWMWMYGYWTVLVFRFTPGIRFPGHLTCGAMGLSKWKFLAVDWIAATLSVPTQILLVAFYGEEILQTFARFRAVVAIAVALGVITFIVMRVTRKRVPVTAPVTESENQSKIV